MDKKRNILVVDDDEINLMILNKGVQEAGFCGQSFLSGEDAWVYLSQKGSSIDIALLDKMMPNMNGIELLRKIKSEPSLKHIPVIIQTGDAGVSQMREGLEAGAYYYLTKPYHPEILTAILQSAENDCLMRERLAELSAQKQQNGLVPLMTSGEFQLRTLDDARTFAAAVADASADPEFTAIGLAELLANSIEHGNLEIGYEQKRAWLISETWQEELTRRAALFIGRMVHVRVQQMKDSLYLMIVDEGKGFDWHPYLFENGEEPRLNEPNGRGIAKAAVMLDAVRYVGNGSEVHCSVRMRPGVIPEVSPRLVT